MLELVNVTKRYADSVAVDSCNLTVQTGEFVTLLGPSGSGKSTLLNLIAGFIPLSSGQIRLDGRDIGGLSAAERGIGVVFQNYALFPHMTIFDNIAYGLRRRKWPAERLRQRVGEMLELIGLQQTANRRPDQLSGGQQQRVALARALAFEPALLLMDEPLGALDREIRDQMQQEIRRIHRETRPSVVYVTHNREEAFALADRVAILQGGHVRAYDTALNLYTRPATRFVASFFGAHQLFPVKVRPGATPGEVEIALMDGHGRMPAPAEPEGPHMLAVGPREIRLANGVTHGIAAEVEVLDRIFMGDTVRLVCIHKPTGNRLAAEMDSHLAHDVSVGQSLKLDIGLDHAALVSA